jgi:hypothetical protein
LEIVTTQKKKLPPTSNPLTMLQNDGISLEYEHFPHLTDKARCFADQAKRPLRIPAQQPLTVLRHTD